MRAGGSGLRGHHARPAATAARPRRWLVIMVKDPEVGRVKTRLGRDIGRVAATAFYRHTSHAIVGRLARDPRWTTVLAVAPDVRLPTRMFPPGPLRITQGSGDLGARMQRVMDTLPPGPAVIVGTDIPAIRPHRIARAFAALGTAPAVFGPAPDGGYWLVGLRRTPRVERPFRPVRWSSEHALSDTRANLAAPAQAALVTCLDDVDDGGTHARVKAWSGRRVLPWAV